MPLKMDQNTPFQKENMNFVFWEGHYPSSGPAVPLVRPGDTTVYYHVLSLRPSFPWLSVALSRSGDRSGDWWVSRPAGPSVFNVPFVIQANRSHRRRFFPTSLIDWTGTNDQTHDNQSPQNFSTKSNWLESWERRTQRKNLHEEKQQSMRTAHMRCISSCTTIVKNIAQSISDNPGLLNKGIPQWEFQGFRGELGPEIGRLKSGNF